MTGFCVFWTLWNRQNVLKFSKKLSPEINFFLLRPLLPDRRSGTRISIYVKAPPAILATSLGLGIRLRRLALVKRETSRKVLCMVEPPAGPLVLNSRMQIICLIIRDVTDCESESDGIRHFFWNPKSNGYLKSDCDGFGFELMLCHVNFWLSSVNWAGWHSADTRQFTKLLPK